MFFFGIFIGWIFLIGALWIGSRIAILKVRKKLQGKLHALQEENATARQEAFRSAAVSSESGEWLNVILARWWKTMKQSVELQGPMHEKLAAKLQKALSHEKLDKFGLSFGKTQFALHLPEQLPAFKKCTLISEAQEDTEAETIVDIEIDGMFKDEKKRGEEEEDDDDDELSLEDESASAKSLFRFELKTKVMYNGKFPLLPQVCIPVAVQASVTGLSGILRVNVAPYPQHTLDVAFYKEPVIEWASSTYLGKRRKRVRLEPLIFHSSLLGPLELRDLVDDAIRMVILRKLVLPHCKTSHIPLTVRKAEATEEASPAVAETSAALLENSAEDPSESTLAPSHAAVSSLCSATPGGSNSTPDLPPTTRFVDTDGFMKPNLAKLRTQSQGVVKRGKVGKLRGDLIVLADQHTQTDLVHNNFHLKDSAHDEDKDGDDSQGTTDPCEEAIAVPSAAECDNDNQLLNADGTQPTSEAASSPSTKGKARSRLRELKRRSFAMKREEVKLVEEADPELVTTNASVTEKLQSAAIFRTPEDITKVWHEFHQKHHGRTIREEVMGHGEMPCYLYQPAATKQGQKRRVFIRYVMEAPTGEGKPVAVVDALFCASPRNTPEAPILLAKLVENSMALLGLGMMQRKLAHDELRLVCLHSQSKKMICIACGSDHIAQASSQLLRFCPRVETRKNPVLGSIQRLPSQTK